MKNFIANNLDENRGEIGKNVFGAALVAYWIGFLIAILLPIKEHGDYVVIVTIMGLLIPFILGFLSGKKDLF